MIERRPIAIAALVGVFVGSVLTSLFLWHFGSAFGLIRESSSIETSNPTSNRWPLEETEQKDGDAVLRVPPAVPLKYSPPKKEASRAMPEISSEESSEMVEQLRKRHLLIPVEGVDPKDLKTSFHEARGERMHEAIDILAARNTPVLAVEDGTVAKLYFSDRGGITVYEFDPEKNYVYYYAHLERYAEGLKEADHLKRGQVIGYVGTSGNAPKDTPHLHFAIVRLNEDKHWWEGNPIDPFLVLR
jgi:murein DD-endopeptidase MepM/ murein hydrolase activator NlpD